LGDLRRAVGENIVMLNGEAFFIAVQVGHNGQLKVYQISPNSEGQHETHCNSVENVAFHQDFSAHSAVNAASGDVAVHCHSPIRVDLCSSM